MKRLLSKTVWAPDSLPGVQSRFRGIYTLFLPLVDALLIIFGVYGFFYGSRVVESFTLPWFGPVWSICIAVAALVAAFGLIGQKDGVEIGAKVALVALFLVYGYLLTREVVHGGMNAGLTIVLLCLGILIMATRILDLIGEIAKETPGTHA
jgi:hypothetical protein